MFKIFVILISAVLSRKKLQFNNENRFKILHLTDLHFGEGVSDEYNVQGIYTILSFTEPDLVVVTGDLVSGYSYGGGDHFFQDCHEKFVQPFKDLNIPYLITLGNHDDEANMNREDIMKLDQQQNLSYSMDYPFHGTNYYVPIYGRDGENEELRIWAFDTNDNGCGGHSASWGCIEQEVVDKFRQINQKPNYGIALMHIPPPEFMDMYGNQTTFGFAADYVACPLVNTGIIDAILDKNNIQLLLVGHNHNNDYGGKYPNEKSHFSMMYGRKSGYGGYKLCCGRKMGGRLIEFKQSGHVVSYSQHIVDYTNKTIHQNYYDRTSDQDECSLTSGAVWGAYEYVGLIVCIYFILSLLVLFMLCLKYDAQIHQNKYEERSKSNLSQSLLNNQL